MAEDKPIKVEISGSVAVRIADAKTQIEKSLIGMKVSEDLIVQMLVANYMTEDMVEIFMKNIVRMVKNKKADEPVKAEKVPAVKPIEKAK